MGGGWMSKPNSNCKLQRLKITQHLKLCYISKLHDASKLHDISKFATLGSKYSLLISDLLHGLAEHDVEEVHVVEVGGWF